MKETPVLYCACGALWIGVRWQRRRDGRRVIRADCGRCGRFRFWMKRTPLNVKYADRAAQRARERRGEPCE
jgi:hypothetical protein